MTVLRGSFTPSAPHRCDLPNGFWARIKAGIDTGAAYRCDGCWRTWYLALEQRDIYGDRVETWTVSPTTVPRLPTQRPPKADLVQADDWGSLLEMKVPGDEPVVIVEVINATPGPSGERQKFWLRVPPQMRTAREAVAWTFGYENVERYTPTVQT